MENQTDLGTNNSIVNDIRKDADRVNNLQTDRQTDRHIQRKKREKEQWGYLYVEAQVVYQGPGCQALRKTRGEGKDNQK